MGFVNHPSTVVMVKNKRVRSLSRRPMTGDTSKSVITNHNRTVSSRTTGDDHRHTRKRGHHHNRTPVPRPPESRHTRETSDSVPTDTDTNESHSHPGDQRYGSKCDHRHNRVPNPRPLPLRPPKVRVLTRMSLLSRHPHPSSYVIVTVVTVSPHVYVCTRTSLPFRSRKTCVHVTVSINPHQHPFTYVRLTVSPPTSRPSRLTDHTQESTTRQPRETDTPRKMVVSSILHPGVLQEEGTRGL